MYNVNNINQTNQQTGGPQSSEQTTTNGQVLAPNQNIVAPQTGIYAAGGIWCTQTGSGKTLISKDNTWVERKRNFDYKGPHKTNYYWPEQPDYVPPTKHVLEPPIDVEPGKPPKIKTILRVIMLIGPILLIFVALSLTIAIIVCFPANLVEIKTVICFPIVDSLPSITSFPIKECLAEIIACFPVGESAAHVLLEEFSAAIINNVYTNYINIIN